VGVKLAQNNTALSTLALDGAGTGDPGSWRAETALGTAWGWLAIEVSAAMPGVQGTLVRRGWRYIRPAGEQLKHDADGNLIEDSRWAYQ
jgi:hypothetical protein